MQTFAAQAIGDIGDASKNEFLFDNPARAALRREIMAAIIDGVPLMVCTGPSGSGKATLASRLAATLPGNVAGVFISQSTDNCRRFEDVLLRVCRHIAPEISWNDHPDAKEIQLMQTRIRACLTENNIRLLLIVVQAEQAFLAMLERVRKMLDTVNDGGLRMQLFLVGQESLLADLNRLRLVHFEEIAERYFTMPLVEEDELPDFLDQWLQKAAFGLTGEDVSRREWQKICAESAGRPGVLSALLAERIDALTGNEARSGTTESGKAASGETTADTMTANGFDSGSRRSSQRVSPPEKTAEPKISFFENAQRIARQTHAALPSVALAARRRRLVHGLTGFARSAVAAAITIVGIFRDGIVNFGRLIARVIVAIGHGIGGGFYGAGRGLFNVVKLIAEALAALGRGGIDGARRLGKLMARTASAVLSGIGHGLIGLGKIAGRTVGLIVQAVAALGRGGIDGAERLGKLMARAASAVLSGIGHGLIGLGKIGGRTVGMIAAAVGAAFRTIIGICGAFAAKCRRRAHMFFQTLAGKAAKRKITRQEASQATAAQNRSAGKPLSPPISTGTLKKVVISVAVLCLVAGAGAALWQGFSRLPPPDDTNKQDKPPALTTTASPLVATLDGDKTGAPGEETTGLPAQSDRTEPEKTAADQEPIPSTAAGIPMPSPSARENIPTQRPAVTAPTIEPRPELVQPEPVKPEVVKINADKVKKEIEPPPAPKSEPKPELSQTESVRPIHIAHTVVMEKTKPHSVLDRLEPSPAKTAKASEPEKTTSVSAPVKEEENQTTARKTEPSVKKLEPESGGAYDAGLSVGQRWISGKNSGQYTVQVMTTNAKEAQSLVASLAGHHASRVRIVPAGAGRVTIFYGDYPSMTEARHARAALPAALRQGNPYAISVDGAMGRLKAR